MQASLELVPAGAVQPLSAERRYRVLVLHFGGPHLRGSEIVLAEVLKRLLPQRWHIDLLSENDILPKYLGQHEHMDIGVRHNPHILFDGAARELEPSGVMGQVAYLARLIRRKKIDVVYCNSARPAQTAFLAARLTGRPIVCHLHIPYTKRYYYQYFVRWCDRLVVTCEMMRDQVLEKLGSAPPIDIAYNGVDTHRFKAPERRDPAMREKFGITPDEIVVGHVGALVRQKGLDVLIPAFAKVWRQYPKAKLMLVGPGELLEALQSQARDEGIAARVLFPGKATHPEEYLHNVFDINVLSSRIESFPLTLLEASAAGCPSVATTVGGVPEMLENGVSGLLVPPLNVDALASAIAELVGSEARRNELARNARARVVSMFDYANTTEIVEKSLLQAIRGRAGGAA